MRKLLGCVLGVVLILGLSSAALAQGLNVGAGYWVSSTNVTAEGVTATEAITGNAIMLHGDYAVGGNLGLEALYTTLKGGVVNTGALFGGEDPMADFFAGSTADLSYLRLGGSYNLFPGSAMGIAPFAGYVRTAAAFHPDKDRVAGFIESMFQEEWGPATVEVTVASNGYNLAGYAVGASFAADLGDRLVARGTAAYLLGLAGSWDTRFSATIEIGSNGEPMVLQGPQTATLSATGPVTASGLELMGSIGYRVTPQLSVEAGYRYLSLNISKCRMTPTWQFGEESGEMEDEVEIPAMSPVTSGLFAGVRYNF